MKKFQMKDMMARESSKLIKCKLLTELRDRLSLVLCALNAPKSIGLVHILTLKHK